MTVINRKDHFIIFQMKKPESAAKEKNSVHVFVVNFGGNLCSSWPVAFCTEDFRYLLGTSPKVTAKLATTFYPLQDLHGKLISS